MGWVTLALRKMTLRQRINNLESDLLQKSQELQTVHNSSSYAQRRASLQQDYEISIVENRYDEQVATIYDIYSDDKVSDDEKRTLENYGFGKLTSKYTTDANATTSYQAAMTLAERQYMKDKQQLESIFERQNERLQDETDRKTKSIEAEQTQIETQLAAARAELESVSSAIDSDIKDNTIKLSA